MFDTRRIGATEMRTTRLGFGCSGIGNLQTVVRETDAQAVLERAWEAGIRYFDTAPHYGRGRSEARLGRFLKGHDGAVISTKVGRVLTPGSARDAADGFVDPLPHDVHYDYSGDGLRRSLDGSRQRLGRDFIDIVYVHDIGRLTHGGDHARHLRDLLDTGLPALATMKAEGRIGAYGLGVNECDICLEVMSHADLDAILLAGRWTLLDRSAETELVPLCRARGTSLVLGGIFNSGILATGSKPGAWFDYAPATDDILDAVTRLQGRAEGMGMTLPQAAMQFALTRPEVASVLIGTGRTASLNRNLDAIAAPVPGAAADLFGD